MRGGSWNNNHNNAAAVYRNRNNPNNRNNNNGFRVVWSASVHVLLSLSGAGRWLPTRPGCPPADPVPKLPGWLWVAGCGEGEDSAGHVWVCTHWAVRGHRPCQAHTDKPGAHVGAPAPNLVRDKSPALHELLRAIQAMSTRLDRKCRGLSSRIPIFATLVAYSSSPQQCADLLHHAAHMRDLLDQSQFSSWTMRR